MDFPGGASDKEPTCQWRRCKSCRFDPWLGRYPGRGHGNPFQYSCLENPMDRVLAKGQSIGCKKSDMTEATWHMFMYSHIS